MKIVDTYNVAVGAAVGLLSTIFGRFWFLFGIYLLLNVLDWLTGWYKARKLCRESSKVGLAGAVKKLGYWAIILVGFLIPAGMIELASIFGVDASFLVFLGWFTLATLIINEARSILENLVECGYHVPPFLIRGLAVTQKLIDSRAEAVIPEEKE